MFVYRIDTNLTKQEAESIYKNLTLEEIEDVESFNMKAFDLEINGLMTSFVITSRPVLARIILFLRQKQIEFEYEDISNEILLSDIQFDDIYFQGYIDDFISENITIDYVLDKINKRGIENLSDLDKKFLENLK